MAWTNEEVKSGMKKVVSSERENLVLFLRLLVEVENRELFLEEGASTIYDYCERFLRLSHGTALKRVWVARATSKFPLILELLERGKLTLSAVSYLVKHLTLDNHVELLTEAQGKNEPELRWWLAKLFPEALPEDWKRNGREKVIPLDGERGKFILIVDKEFIEQRTSSTCRTFRIFLSLVKSPLYGGKAWKRRLSKSG